MVSDDCVGRGSSPPARGPPTGSRLSPFAPGLIPACAGTTAATGKAVQGSTAHPRLRGDHQCTGREHVGSEGSSPPARGPPAFLADVRFRLRLIPACAGTTWARHRRSSSRRAHPRLRGDHAPDGEKQGVLRGSSPPARGPLIKVAAAGWKQGLIPACAGTTTARRTPWSAARAHPRLRGDHVTYRPHRGRRCCSSPPARGPRWLHAFWKVWMRLIPACAGTTQWAAC